MSLQLVFDFFKPASKAAEVDATPQFAHPQATRTAVLNGVTVAYEFKRRRRRTIGFSVGDQGLVVSAARWVPLSEVDKAVQEKSKWIVEKLHEMRQRRAQLEAARVVWQDGAQFDFLGRRVVLRLDPSHGFSGVGAQLGLDDVLCVGLAQNASAEQIKDTVHAWLMREAKQLFVERLNHFAPQLKVQWMRLSLSNASTRWGSASRDGSIRLNWRLIHFNLPVIDYVVVHELSHLRVMDHSPQFWDTVRSVVPDYAALRGQLKSVRICAA